MARRRYSRRGGRTSTRLMGWTSNVETVVTGTAANTVRRVVLAVATVDKPVTIYRMVGSIAVGPQTDVDEANYHMGIYLGRSGAGGAFPTLDPSSAADVSKETWMWWTARQQLSANGTGHFLGFTIPVDIKVKRVMTDTNQRIELVIVSRLAFVSLVNLRILGKITGTR